MKCAQHFSRVLPANNRLQFIILLFFTYYLPLAQAIIAYDDRVTTSPNAPVTIPILANDIDNRFMIVFATGDAFNNQFCSTDEHAELKCHPLGFAANSSYQVALGDMNQDGLLDVVLANYELPNQICLATNSDFLCRQIGEHAFNSMDVALADIDGDQILDAVFANRDNRNSVCLGDGQGEFECQTLNDLPARNFGVTVDDFNQDGYLDAIFATFFQNDKLCLGDGEGGFECNTLRLYATSSVAVASGDLNNDQRIDAVFSTITGGSQICLNEGQAVFSCTDMISKDEIIPEHFQSNNLALADINEDSQLDAVFAVPGEPNRMCLGNGSGQFSCESIPGAFWSYGVAVGYVNEDKILDMVFANDGDPNRLCFGQGKGQFVCQAINADKVFTTDVALGFSGFDLSHLRIVEPPVHGRASIDSEGNLIYTPKFSFSGRDTLSYQINEAKALVTITIEPQIKYSSEPPPHRLLHFGKTLVEQPLSLSLEVHNQGNLPVVIDSVTFSGEHAEVFKWSSPTLPYTVEERSAEFTLQCAPTDTGIKTATLTLHTNDPQQPTPSYPLRCSSHLTPEAGYFSQPSINNNTLDVGQTLVNTATTAELTFIEKGNAPLVVELTELGGNHPEIFQLLNAHWPLTITEGGAAKTLTIQCIPTQLGVQTALLKLSTNDPQYPSPVYLLSCRGHNEPQAIYTSQPPVKSTLDFGKTQIATPITLAFDIIEQGNIALEIEFSEIQGLHAEDFEWITPELPTTLADGEAPLQVTLQCTPSAMGLRTATLVLHSNDPQKPILN
ncbi:MAG: choice-of-anchor D domain-containing protein, partial [Pseudomonadota bacterium]|nr:choice-of-anchor D domain-containing protein [Pseudomonadota bacterium]